MTRKKVKPYETPPPSSPSRTTDLTSPTTPSGAGIASPLSPNMDVIKMLEYMDKKDEERRKEDEERRKEDNERRKEEFKALVEALTGRSSTSLPATSSITPQATSSITPQATSSAAHTPKVTVNLPPALTPDVTFRQFSEWKQRWQDYAVMVDLNSLTQPKHLIQLRACLSVEMRRVLEHNLGVPPDSTLPLEDVLAKIQTYVKSQQNEALRRLAFT